MQQSVTMIEPVNLSDLKGKQPAPAAPNATAKPTWMKRLQKRKQKPAEPQFPFITETTDDSPQDLPTRVKILMTSAATLSILQSILLHVGILGLLSFIVLEVTKEEIFNTTVTNTEIKDISELNTLSNESISVIQGEESKQDLKAPPITEIMKTDNKTLTAEVDNQISKQVFADKEDADPGDEQAGQIEFMSPPAKNVVRKGNFTAWTIPSDPEPGQQYFIIIHIKVPEKIHRYRVSDLRGYVEGTDGYKQSIPTRYWQKKTYLPMKDQVAQMVVPIPGAEELVRDTIFIASRMLKEQQTLSIEFRSKEPAPTDE